MEGSSFSEELWAQIRKDFGNHYVRYKAYEKAKSNYQESLNINPEKLESACGIAKVQILDGQIDEALYNLNSKSILGSYKNNFNRSLQECDCFYEKNDFEENILILNKKKLIYQEISTEIPHCGNLTFQKLNESKHKGPKLSLLNSRFDMVCTNYDDTLGKNSGNCLFNQRRYFNKILLKWKPPKQNKSHGPIVLISDDPCEFSRNKVEIIIPKTVQEKYRTERVQSFFAQSYMHSAWKDFVFMNELKSHKDFKESKQNAESFNNINNAIGKCIEKNSKIIGQLHARCPLYTRRHQAKSNERDKAAKFISRHKICRDMFNALKDIQLSYKERKLEKLIKLAEHEMGIRYRIHPPYLLPNKNEFTIDICNYIALAHIHDIIKSTSLMNSNNEDDEYELLKKIMRIYWKRKNVAVRYIFGDQSTYRDPAEPDTSFLEFRRSIVHLEERISQKPMLAIERCHLLHEMGRANLKQNRPEEAKEFGQKIVEEAQGVSYFWIFLGHIMMCRADILQKQFYKAIESMNEAISFVEMFKSNPLKLVLDHALKILKRFAVPIKNGLFDETECEN